MFKESSSVTQPLLTSEIVNYPNSDGKKVVAYIDHIASGYEANPFVVMSPKYGETKKNNLQLAYYLAANGLNVLRFDHTNHVGESDGSIAGFTFPGAVSDIVGSIDFIERQFGQEEVVMLAASLSARSALRAAAVDHRISAFVSLVGVFNFRETLKAVYQKDLVGDHIVGVFSGITDILGHQVNVANFMGSCIEEEMHTLEGTIADVRQSKASCFLFYGENDVWVDVEDIKRVESAESHVFLQRIPDAMHEIRENPQAAERTMREIAFTCRFRKLPDEEGLAAVQVPEKKRLFRQNKIERERLRKVNPVGGTEKEFWRAYLGKYEILQKVSDYQEYLDCVGKNLGEIDPGQIVFDCGCGNGLFGIWTMRDLLKRRRAAGNEAKPLYVGLDLTEKGLSDALFKHDRARSELRRGITSDARDLQFVYTSFDLDEISEKKASLPFDTGTFHKICCSLLISYLKSPKSLMRELHRVLRPGCPIVVSSMKPFCDLSVIYRDFLGEEFQDEDLDSARNLMSAAGAIKLKEEHGQYIFFEREELAELAVAAGFREVKSFRSFGDQANLITAVK